MRLRERQRLELVVARHAPRIQIVWARALRNAEAWAIHSSEWFCIVIDEERFEAMSSERRVKVVLHEVAHILAWERYGVRILDHGPEWRKTFNDLRRAERDR